MAQRQMSLFSFLTPKVENKEKIVTTVLEKLVDDVVRGEEDVYIVNKPVNNVNKQTSKPPKKNPTDYIMTTEKINQWSNDERFKFWDTPNGKPVDDKSKFISWFDYVQNGETFTCWVCKKYPNLNNKENKVTMGCSRWHINYLIRHDDNKHKVFIFYFFIS